MQRGQNATPPGGWIVAGSVAAVASAVVLSLCGLAETGRPAGPTNGPSQWLWGRSAAHRRGFSIRHTVTGYLIHHASSLFWSAIHARMFPRRGIPAPLHRDLLQGAATATLACFVDYRVTPRRFQPGFEAQLGKGSLLLTYAAFGVSLAMTWRLLHAQCLAATPASRRAA